MILLDFANLCYQAQAGCKVMHAGEQETTAINGVVNFVRDFREQFNGPMIALHEGRSWRKDFFPEYKANRDNGEVQTVQNATRSAIDAQKPRIIRALSLLGVSHMRASNLEADDLAARLRASNTAKQRHTTLVSGDQDWLQLINPHTSVYNSRKSQNITADCFEDKIKLPHPKAMAEYKALMGDKSDNIPGCGGIGPVTASHILNTYGSFNSFANECLTNHAEYDLHNKYTKALIDDPAKQAIFDRNMKLIWLDHPDSPPSENPTFLKGELNKEGFAEFCEEHALLDILKNFDSWVRPFETVK